MRRDMEYCIKLMKEIANNEFKRIIVIDNTFDQTTTNEEVEENKKYFAHLKMLKSGNLISLKYSGGSGVRVNIIETELIWDGHDFLDMTDNENLWGKVKNEIKSKGFELARTPLDVLVNCLKLKASEFGAMIE